MGCVCFRSVNRCSIVWESNVNTLEFDSQSFEKWENFIFDIFKYSRLAIAHCPRYKSNNLLIVKDLQGFVIEYWIWTKGDDKWRCYVIVIVLEDGCKDVESDLRGKFKKCGFIVHHVVLIIRNVEEELERAS